jgi:hypothetical protein
MRTADIFRRCPVLPLDEPWQTRAGAASGMCVGKKPVVQKRTRASTTLQSLRPERSASTNWAIWARGMRRCQPWRTRKLVSAVSAGLLDGDSAVDFADICQPAQDWTTKRPAMIRQAPMAYFRVSGSFRKKAAISGTSTKVRAMKE